jgi:hypothetical protein
MSAQKHIWFTTTLRTIPWDVWLAAVMAVAVAIVTFSDSAPAIFTIIYLGLCAYIAVQTFGSERER